MAGRYLNRQLPEQAPRHSGDGRESTSSTWQPVTARLPMRVDKANEARVRLDLLAVLHASAPHMSGLVIDMTRTSIIDSSGLRALRTVQGHADELGLAVCVAAPHQDVRRLLRLADIAGRIPVFTSVGAALTALSPPPETPGRRPGERAQPGDLRRA